MEIINFVRYLHYIFNQKLRNMKKTILIVALSAAAFAVQAQTTFGAHAGINGAIHDQQEYTSGRANNNCKSEVQKLGLHWCKCRNTHCQSSLVFSPELNFIQKGGK